MPNETTTIHLTELDFHNLKNLFESLPPHQQEQLDNLEDELFRAEIVQTEQMPPDVVTMHSKVRFEDLDSGKVTEVQLTYPEDACIEEARISVLAPIGTALLGLTVGQTIAWPLPGGRTKRLMVKQVLHQPESIVNRNHRKQPLMVS